MKIKILEEANVDPPEFGSDGAAGLDLRADVSRCEIQDETVDGVDRVSIPANGEVKIPLGVSVAPEPGWTPILLPRSSSKFMLRNTIGLIDTDYRGELLAIVLGFRDLITIEHNERLVQLIEVPVNTSHTFVDTLDETGRGSGGFGDSGRF